MKFAEHLAAHITPEWRKQYIQYEEMKNMLYTAVEQMPSPEVADPQEVTRYTRAFDEEFIVFCDKELTKINTFFAEKMAEASRKFVTLKGDLNTIKNRQQHASMVAASRKNSNQLRRRSSLATTAGRTKGASEKAVNFNTELGNANENQDTLEARTPLIPSIGIPNFGSVFGSTREDVVIGATKKMHEMKLAFAEFYLSLVLLQNYQSLNFTGFRKILKKHDKLLLTDAGQSWRVQKVDSAPFYATKDIAKLIEDTENLVTSELEQGDRQRAMKRLRVPPLGEQQSPWVTYRLGLFSGAFITLLIVVVLSAIFRDTQSEWRVVFRLYRGCFLVAFFLFLMGLNVYGWRTSGVNHVLIFELDPRDHLSEQHLMEISASFLVLWSVSVLLFIYSPSVNIPPFANPLVLVIIMSAFLLYPFPVMAFRARTWLLKVLLRICFAPFCRVTFADFWLADQLNSLVPVLLDFQYFLCFYTSDSRDWFVNKDTNLCIGGEPKYVFTRTLVACLPAWFRLAQCLRRWHDDGRKSYFPHIINAGKYSTTFLVVILSTGFKLTEHLDTMKNPFFYMWVCSLLISSCYTYLWDIKMDWGLFDPKAPPESRWLREETVYKYAAYYYVAIIGDALLRFGWTFSISLTELGWVTSDYMVTILAPLEIIRRFGWNYLRLENEHLNNCGQFRAVRDISIAPIDAGDQEKIIRMMDEKWGVTNRSTE